MAKPGSATCCASPASSPDTSARAKSGFVKPFSVATTLASRAAAAASAAAATSAGRRIAAAAATRSEAGAAPPAPRARSPMSFASASARSPARVAAWALSLLASPRSDLTVGAWPGWSKPRMPSPSRNARWWSWPLSRSRVPTAACTCSEHFAFHSVKMQGQVRSGALGSGAPSTLLRHLHGAQANL